ncbi:MAG: DUF6438 domain-containing protein [Ekhidna sp.]
MRSLIQIILVICALTSCKSQKSSQESSFKDSLEKYNSLKDRSHFSLKAGSCMGTCPVFEFFFVSDSLVLLTAKENILSTGNFYYQLNEKEAKDLTDLLLLDWDKYESEYTTTMKDLPSMDFKIKSKDGIKRIRVAGTDPEILFSIKEEIIKKIDAYEWEKMEISKK